MVLAEVLEPTKGEVDAVRQGASVGVAIGGSMSNWAVDIIRGATRPIVTIIMAAVVAQIVVEGIDAPAWFLSLAGACILWWFGQQTIRSLKDKKDVE